MMMMTIWRLTFCTVPTFIRILDVRLNYVCVCGCARAGQYGDVYVARWKRHNLVVAVKTLKVRYLCLISSNTRTFIRTRIRI